MTTTSGPRRFGVEEEYLLLGAVSAKPLNRATDVILATSETNVEHEYFSSQIEVSTPVCSEASEAEAALTCARAAASREAAGFGAVVAGAGLPPVGGDIAGSVAPKERYRRIEAAMRSVAQYQYSTGTHVHVEVPSRNAGVEVLARIARWVPTLLALTANSPLWCGKSTGFASWRHIMGLSWPVSGYPQVFDDADHYQLTVRLLIRAGIIPDPGMLTWVARLSDTYSTIELRIADAQLEARDTVAFAALVRAFVEHTLTEAERGIERPRFGPSVVNGANWLAARNGLSSELIDLYSGDRSPAFIVVDRLISEVEVELDRFGDRTLIHDWVSRLRQNGTPAERQLAAFARGGLGALLELYRNCLSPTVAAALEFTTMAVTLRRKLSISRERDGDDFVYRRDGRKIRSPSELARIEALAVPPAWEDVEIARSRSARVLARGVDAAGRVQAIYHPAFRRRQDREKFERMLRFGRTLPRLRSRVDRDLRRRRLGRDRVVACVIRLIDLQFFRVGNSEYARRHRSYGATTLRREHVTATGSSVEFNFVGKSGKRQQRRVSDPRLARIIGQLLELPGSEVFKFLDEEGEPHDVRSRHVNAYVKRHMGEEFTAKDFRTWGASALVASELLALDGEELESAKGRDAAVRDAIRVAAERLGNTYEVTRSSYIDPRIIETAEQPNTLAIVQAARVRPRRYFSREEQRAMRLLADSSARKGAA